MEDSTVKTGEPSCTLPAPLTMQKIAKKPYLTS